MGSSEETREREERTTELLRLSLSVSKQPRSNWAQIKSLKRKKRSILKQSNIFSCIRLFSRRCVTGIELEEQYMESSSQCWVEEKE